MFHSLALDVLVEAAKDPLTLVGFVILVVSSVVSIRARRHKVLLRNLEKLPESDRLRAIELEMGPIPKKGITAEHWLRARKQKFTTAQLGIVCSALLIAFVVYREAEHRINGNIMLDGRPLHNAKITILGVEGERKSDENGFFTFQRPNDIGDSVNFMISYTAGYEAIHLDTTVSTAAVSNLKFNLASKESHPFAGQIVDAKTEKGVANATITISQNRGRAISDTQGNFHTLVSGKPYEGIEATISHPHYETGTIRLALAEGHRITLRKKP